MPRKLVVCLVLTAVMLVLVVAVQPPDFVDQRVHNHHLGRTIFWCGLLLTLPWPEVHMRRAAMGLALTTTMASFADAVTSHDHMEGLMTTVCLLRGLLGMATSLLVLWTLTRTDVLMWSTERERAGSEGA